MAMLRAFGVTDKGRIRTTNEDCFGIDLDLQLCVVADGMGGHNAGEVASQMAVETVLDYVAAHRDTDSWPYGYDEGHSAGANLLRTAVQVANARVFEAAAGSTAWAGMGTTIVAVLVHGATLAIAHVGDSRLYALSGGRADPLTRDDSWAATMLARDPSLDPAMLSTHPMRNALTKVIGSKALVEVHVSERVSASDDLFALTTDGVHGVLSEAQLTQAAVDPDDLAGIAGRLVEAALEAGSRDNCTAVVVRVDADERA